MQPCLRSPPENRLFERGGGSEAGTRAHRKVGSSSPRPHRAGSAVGSGPRVPWVPSPHEVDEYSF